MIAHFLSICLYGSVATDSSEVLSSCGGGDDCRRVVVSCVFSSWCYFFRSQVQLCESREVAGTLPMIGAVWVLWPSDFDLVLFVLWIGELLFSEASCLCWLSFELEHLKIVIETAG